MTEKTQYRLVVKYRRTRPYYTESYMADHSASSHHQAWYQEDIDAVGRTKEIVVGPYRTTGAVKAQWKRLRESYPLYNTYSDNEQGYDIISMTWEKCEPVIVWKEFTP